MQDEKYGSGTVDTVRKMHYNKAADERLFKEYLSVLQKNMPFNDAEFKNVKYFDQAQSSLLASYMKSIKCGELTPLADFDLYKQINSEIDNKLVGVTTANGITITGKSNHFIARIIGSVEQRRSGVTVDQVLDALQNPVAITSVKRAVNGSSQKFKSSDCFVSVNPDTGILIQTNLC